MDEASEEGRLRLPEEFEETASAANDNLQDAHAAVRAAYIVLSLACSFCNNVK